uniref:EGF-like domain-containing protein n=1 Tax=Panagrellus redivivus TaxID=6233 RepID=A0A7E4WBE0_PANRE
MAPIGGFGLLNSLVAVCLLLGASAEKFDVTLHYDKINHDNLETLHFNSKTLIDTHTLTLNQRLQKVFADKDLKLQVYDVIESGIEEGFPAISLSAHVDIPSLNSRDAFVKVWEESKHPDLLLFSVYQTENALPEVDGVHRFHAKYAAKAVGECANNGILLPNATCICPRYFSGDDCSLQTCLNGGIISTSRHCVCPPGFTGRHCEQLGCTPYYDSEFNFTTKSFVLAVNLKFDTAFLLSSINSGLADALVNNSAQYSNYVLITYVMSGYKLFSQIKTVDTAANFLGNFSSIYPNDGDILQPHITAINAGLTVSTHIRPRSDIYTFWVSQPSNDTTYNPYDLSKNSGETVLTKTLLNWGHAFYTVTPYSETAATTVAFKRLSAISNGEYINLGTRTSNAGPILSALIKNNINAQTIEVYRNFNGTANVVIGKTPTPVIVYTYGPSLTLTVQGSAASPVATYGSFSIYNVDASASSVVAQATTTGNGASVRAFTSSLNSVVIGYAKNTIIDVSSNFPTALIPQTVVGRIIDPNANLSVSSIVIADLYDTARTNEVSRTVQPNSTRDCNFPTVYGALTDSNSCTAGEAILVSVTYDTVNGDTVYRAIPSVCFQPKPASQVTAPACNGNGYLSTNNGSCVCNANYAGANCEKVLCQNGGIQNQFPGNGRPKCVCLDGYSGDLCDQLTCSTPATRPDTSRTTLSLVIQSTWSTSPFLGAFKTISTQLVRSLSNADTYVITTFANISNAAPIVSTQVFTNSTAFTTTVSTPNGGASAIDQPQNVIAALNSALNANVTHPLRQAVYLFVDAAIGESQTDIDALIVKAITLATPINVILLKPYSTMGDETVTCLNDTSAYANLAKVTGGLFLNFCTVDSVSSIPTFLNAHAQFLPNWQTVSRADGVNCGAALNVSVEQRDGIPTRPLIIVSSNPNATFQIHLNGPGTLYPPISPNGALAGAAVTELFGLDQIGDYIATVTPSNGAATDTCTVILGVQTGQSVLAGFTANPSIDYTSLPPQFGTPSHPALFISTQLQSTPTVQINITDGASDYTSQSSLRNSSSCQFDYYFPDVYSCPLAGNVVSINARFTNDDGVAFSRVIPSVCQAPPAGTCLNGGYLADNSSICTCPIGFSGPLCAGRVCLNGGYIKNDQCICPQGFSGELCQLVECPAWDFLAAHRQSSFQYESVAFVVELSMRGLVTNLGLANQISEFISQVHTTRPLQLILVTFTNTVIDRVIVTTDPHKFTSVFQATLNNVDNYVITNESVALDAVHEAAKLVTYKPAILFTFASTDPKTPSDFFRSEDSLTKLIDRGGLQINFYLNRPDNVLPAVTDPHGGYYSYYQITAAASGGRIFLLSPVDVEQALESLLPLAVFEDAIIEDQTFDDCTTPQTLYFPVDNEVVSVSVNVRGKQINTYNSVLFYDPSGQLIDSDKLNIVTSTGSAAFAISDVVFTPQHIGFWRVAVQSQLGSCQVQVRAITANTIRFGFSTDITSDFPTNILNTDATGVPAFNHTRYITAHIDNQLYSMRKTFLEYVKVYQVNSDSGHTELLAASAFLPRDPNTCAYQYVSPALTIPSISYHGLGMLQIVASGQDAHGETFQRIHYTTPQIPNCYNGGSPDSYDYCTCPANYSGDYCERPVCQNGGTSDIYVCQCAEGYYGDFCENQIVLPTGPTTVAPSTVPNDATSGTDASTVSGSTVSAATVVTESTPTSGTDTSTGYQSTVSGATESTVTSASTEYQSTDSSVSVSTFSTASPPTEPTQPSTASESTVSWATESTESTYSTSEASTSSLAPATTTTPLLVPPTPSIDPNCPYAITMGVYLTVVVDTTSRVTSSMQNLYTNILTELFASPHLSSTAREVTLFTSSGSGTVGTPVSFNNASGIIDEITAEIQYSHSASNSQANLNTVLSKYNPTPIDPEVVAPTIVIFTAAQVSDYPAASVTIDRIRTANPRSFVVSVPLTSLNADNLASTTFDATFDLIQATSTSAADTSAKILNFICSVTPRSFGDL